MVFIASGNRTLTHCSHLVGNRALLAENFIFDDRQNEQHARRRCEISFSSKVPLFERLSFGSEENELGACVLLIWQGLFYVKSMAHTSTR